ncbi:hypothetical protein OPIT5_27690 [Opitutaceae bacterium TAV5]|nr:hypothetical protein OPIT5_27690 [Opitutaceae bacterium TAV5]
MGNLSFHLETVGSGNEVTGLRDFFWRSTRISPAGELLTFSLRLDGVDHTQFELVSATVNPGGTQTQIRLTPSGRPDVTVDLVMETVASRSIAGHAFEGFRYQYRVTPTAPGCEIDERTRWCLSGNPVTGTFFIRNVYEALDYQVGGPAGLNTWKPRASGGEERHSRFGKMQGHDYQHIPGAGFLLVYFDDIMSGLIMNGKKSLTNGGIPRDQDLYYLAQPLLSTPWKNVLMDLTPTAPPNLQQDCLEVGNHVDEHYRSLLAYRLPEPKPFLWGNPRFARFRSMLPTVARLGFKRIWFYSMWNSVPGRSALSVDDWIVSDAWGDGSPGSGLQALADLCAEAHRLGIEVYAWFPFVHLSDISTLLATHPEWASRSARDVTDLLVPLDTTNETLRDYILARLQPVRDAGLDGLWLDSYHNYGIESVHDNGAATISQMPGSLLLQQQLEDMGFGIYIEGMSPLGLTSSALNAGRLAGYSNGGEWRAFNSGFYLDKDKYITGGTGTPVSIGSDISGVPYYGLSSWRCPLALKTRIDVANPLWANFTATELEQIRLTNFMYNSASDRMQGMPEVLPGGLGARWQKADGSWAIFALLDGNVAVDPGHAVLDLHDLSFLTTGSALAAQAGHVYKQVSSLPVFNDAFESGAFASPQGAGVSWTRSSTTGVTSVSGPEALDRTTSALISDLDTTSSESLVASFTPPPADETTVIRFIAATHHVENADNNNWLAVRNGTGDIRLRLRWRQGRLQYGPAWTDFGTYLPGETLVYTLILDESAGTGGILVNNGSGIMNIPIEGNPAAGFNRLAFSSGVVAASRVNWYLDNVSVDTAWSLLADSFESGTSSAPQGAGVSWIASTGTTIGTTDPLSGACSAHLQDHSSSGSEYLLALPPRTSGDGLYRLTFEARTTHVGAQPNNNLVILRNGLGDVRLRLRFQSGNLQTGPSWTTFGTYGPGTIIRYDILLNEAEGTFSVFASNGSSATNLPLEGNTARGIDRIEFRTGVIASSQVDWTIDNVRLEQLRFTDATISPRPSVPQHLAAQAGDHEALLTWTAAPGATSYTLRTSPSSGGPYTLVAADIPGTGYTHTGLTNGEARHYVVSATNAAGESACSVEVAVTPETPPGD